MILRSVVSIVTVIVHNEKCFLCVFMSRGIDVSITPTTSN